MSGQNTNGVAPGIPQELLKQIAESLKPIYKDQVPVYRRNERPPLVSVESPARGRFSAHGIRLVGDLAQAWGQESRYPQALRANGSDVPGFVLFEPVQLWDANAPDQYQIIWGDGFKRALIDLRPILQPRNLEAPTGFVREMPVSLHQLPTGKTYLFLHTGGSKVRAEGEVAAEEEQEAQPPVKEAAPSTEP